MVHSRAPNYFGNLGRSIFAFPQIFFMLSQSFPARSSSARLLSRTFLSNVMDCVHLQLGRTWKMISNDLLWSARTQLWSQYVSVTVDAKVEMLRRQPELLDDWWCDDFIPFYLHPESIVWYILDCSWHFVCGKCWVAIGEVAKKEICLDSVLFQRICLDRNHFGSRYYLNLFDLL